MSHEGAEGNWLAGIPERPVEVPPVLSPIVGDEPARCVWENTLGGLTFELATTRRFLKWAPVGAPLRILEEAKRMRWAAQYARVPEVLDAGTAPDGSTWLLTTAIPGTTAVAPRWKTSPRTAVRAIGEGLRALHEALPTTTCPFSWSAEDRRDRALLRAREGGVDTIHFHSSHRHLSPDEALALVANPPPVDRWVVCHGDACAPNTLLDDRGQWAGHVDLGHLGTGDRWSDLAIATWSTAWNFGPGWEDELLAAYGAHPDPDRTRYYRLLWDLVD